MTPKEQLQMEIGKATTLTSATRLNTKAVLFADSDREYSEEFDISIDDCQAFSIENYGSRPLKLDDRIIIDPFTSRSFPYHPLGVPYIGLLRAKWMTAWDNAAPPAPQFKYNFGAVLFIKITFQEKEQARFNIENS